jgi:segregation and condensation protein B
MENKKNSLSKNIEAILFYKAEPLSLKKLCNILELKEQDIKQGIQELKHDLKDRGITLVEHEDEYTLTTSSETSLIIEKVRKDELNRDLGKAGIETLSIIIYQGPVSRAEIDYIRGVNSQFIVRNLLMRGLVEKVENTKDARSYLYKPSLQLISHLGLSKLDDMPEYEEIRNKINAMKNENSVDGEDENNSDKDKDNREINNK